MANAGTKDLHNVEEWTSTQKEVRRGINLVMDTYRTFIKMHRTICDNVEKFAQGMITKYENELSALDQLNVPTSLISRTTDMGSPAYIRFIDTSADRLKYLDVHRQTLLSAYDCPRDLIQHTIAYHQRIFYPPPPVYAQTVSFATAVQGIAVQYPTESININCNAANLYNGNPDCSNAVAFASHTQMNNLCKCMTQYAA
jgi:hypothetical protein